MFQNFGEQRDSLIREVVPVSLEQSQSSCLGIKQYANTKLRDLGASRNKDAQQIHSKRVLKQRETAAQSGIQEQAQIR